MRKHEQTFAMIERIPRVDLDRQLPIRSRFVVPGNIRDSVLTQIGAMSVPVPLLRGLWARLKAYDFRYLLIYDPIDSMRVYPNEPAVVELARRFRN